MRAPGSASLAPYVAARGGVVDALTRLTAQPGTIAYLGASVTAQADGYRSRLHGKLEEVTGRAHRMVNAGIGGVGSIAGLFLMDRLVLRHDPTLCFVEFLPTDVIGHTPKRLLPDVLRMIVGRIRARECTPVFLHLGRRDADRANRQDVMKIYEQVAAELEVDSIDLASYVDTLGEHTMAASYRDEVHFTPLGAELIAGAACAALTMMRTASGRKTGSSLRGAGDIGALAGAGLVRASLAHVEHPERARQRTFRLALDCVEVGSSTSVQVASGYDVLGLIVVVGPGTGVIRVSDSVGTFDLDLWDRWCHYERLSAVVFPRTCPAELTKTITVLGPSPNCPDTEPPARLTLVGFMAVA